MIDEDNLLGGMTGCFRWSAAKQLPSLPPPKGSSAPSAVVLSEKGWMDYLTSRFDQSIVIDVIKKVKEDLSYIDCLSSPVTIAYIIQQQKLNDNRVPRDFINIIVTAASFKNEERILRETNMWNELAHSLTNVCTINVYLVGPEISETRVGFKTEPLGADRRIVFSLHRGTVKDFLRSRPALLMQAGSTVAFTLNGGFGNFENPSAVRFDLLLSWLPDLYLLSSLSKIPCYFTCANHHADVSGEFMIHNKVMGSRFCAKPAPNPYGFATTLLPEGASGLAHEQHETRGNSFWYGVQGSEAARRRSVLQGGADRGRVVADLLACLVPSGTSLEQEIFLHEPSIDWAPRARSAPAPEPAPEPTPDAIPSPARSIQQSAADGYLSVRVELPPQISLRDVELLVEGGGSLLVLRVAGEQEQRVLLQTAVRVDSLRAKIARSAGGRLLKVEAAIL